MRTFQPRLDILPLVQQRLWPELEVVPSQFVLYGGTAIALRLGHRQSVDFDFFSSEPFEPGQLLEAIPLLRQGRRLQSKANTVSVELEREAPVQLSFLGGLSLGRVGEPERALSNHLSVASMLDLAGLKAAVVQERALRKDYEDVAALLGAGIKLSDALGAARALYRELFNPMITLKALCYFADGDLPTLPEKIKELLTREAASAREIPEMHRLSDRIAP